MKLENEKALIRTIAEGNTKSFEVLFYSSLIPQHYSLTLFISA